MSHLLQRMTVLELGRFLFLINVGQSWWAESTSPGPVINSFVLFHYLFYLSYFFLFCASGTSVKSFEPTIFMLPSSHELHTFNYF